ncbi:hypothetical protein GCM10017691_57170 [Pseudonocardia petroleophila]|uniref:DUF4913 domain-containing protein n=1 Tax=Pseudonocardia petroleophila TaxID=37331 RepID=A0A7G7MN77_9PSEU|nr:hypothetical protein [Pseudonocardia petroleophila]QNG54238.1 hypothetical protein H6H00_10260 [Pseudonocardia petroleophila]
MTAPDPTVAALGRSLARALRRIDTMDTNLLQLASDVAALRTALAPPPAPAADPDLPTGPPPVRSWLLATDVEQAVRDVADLVDWVGHVYVRYTRAQLSSCWLWHPEVLEELWWLRRAHADAYSPEGGSWMRVGDWHDRQRPGVERRVNGLLGKCSLSRHADRNGRRADVVEPVPPPLAGHQAAVAACWVATRTAGPAPTEQVLAEAERAEYTQHRGSR